MSLKHNIATFLCTVKYNRIRKPAMLNTAMIRIQEKTFEVAINREFMKIFNKTQKAF